MTCTSCLEHTNVNRIFEVLISLPKLYKHSQYISPPASVMFKELRGVHRFLLKDSHVDVCTRGGHIGPHGCSSILPVVVITKQKYFFLKIYSGSVNKNRSHHRVISVLESLSSTALRHEQ